MSNRSKTIGFIGELYYDPNSHKIRISQELVPIVLAAIQQGHQAVLIDVENTQNSLDTTVHLVFDEQFGVIATKNESLDLDVIYSGAVGKPVYAQDGTKLNEKNSLANELLSDYCRTLDVLPKGITVVNAPDILIANLAKNYLVELKDKIPMIPAVRAATLDELVHYVGDQELFGGSELWVQPNIGERAKGATSLDRNATPEELIQLFGAYFAFEPTDSPTYNSVMANNGVIIKPIVEGFSHYGETKIAVIDGEVVYAFRRSGESQGAASEKAVFYECTHQLSEQEKALALQAYQTVREHYQADIRYARIDITMHNEQLVINEIELVNPSFCLELDHLHQQYDGRSKEVVANAMIKAIVR